jgi:hypothetical protein
MGAHLRGVRASEGPCARCSGLQTAARPRSTRGGHPPCASARPVPGTAPTARSARPLPTQPACKPHIPTCAAAYGGHGAVEGNQIFVHLRSAAQPWPPRSADVRRARRGPGPAGRSREPACSGKLAGTQACALCRATPGPAPAHTHTPAPLATPGSATTRPSWTSKRPWSAPWACPATSSSFFGERHPQQAPRPAVRAPRLQGARGRPPALPVAGAAGAAAAPAAGARPGCCATLPGRAQAGARPRIVGGAATQPGGHT